MYFSFWYSAVFFVLEQLGKGNNNGLYGRTFALVIIVKQSDSNRFTKGEYNIDVRRQIDGWNSLFNREMLFTFGYLWSPEYRELSPIVYPVGQFDQDNCYRDLH